MKNYKSYTPTRRHVIIADKSGLWKGSAEKLLTKKYMYMYHLIHLSQNNLRNIQIKHMRIDQRNYYKEILKNQLLLY